MNSAQRFREAQTLSFDLGDGLTFRARRPSLLDIMAAGGDPIQGDVTGRVRPLTVKQVRERLEAMNDADKNIDFSVALLKRCLVEPKLVDTNPGEDEVTLDDLSIPIAVEMAAAISAAAFTRAPMGATAGARFRENVDGAVGEPGGDPVRETPDRAAGAPR